MTKWNILSSHMAAVPQFYEAENLRDLRQQIQTTADNKVVRHDRPPMGQISFRYELDENDRVCKVHAYFTNKHGKQARFMKLERQT